MSLRLVLFIYNIVFPVALLFLLPGYLLKIFRRGNYSNSFGERFGIYSSEKKEKLSNIEKPIWIHAVSVGEVNVAIKLIKSLRREAPSKSIVLSTTTPTGHDIAKSSGADLIFYHPLDFLFIVNKALRLIDPITLILTEAEIWPNLVSKANRLNVKVSIINARLSNRSESRYKRFSFFSAPVLRMLNLVCVQDEADIKIWDSLGVNLDKIYFTGSIKYDASHIKTPSRLGEFRELLSRVLLGNQRKIMLAGSTHPGEELMIARKYKILKEKFPELFLIVVPRHVERCKSIIEEISKEGLDVELRSNLDRQLGNRETNKAIDCLIINTTGELGAWYYLSDVVIIGKSFLHTGGQNPVEAIFAGKPVIVGPNMENFSALVSMLNQHKGLIQIDGSETIVESITEILSKPEIAQNIVSNANEVLSCHQGATNRTAKLVVDKSF